MVEDNSVSGTEISDLTSATKRSKASIRSTSKTTGILLVVSEQKNKKWGNPCNKNTKTAHLASSFKDAHAELRRKLFIKGPLQASKYNKAYKAILTYLESKYNHRVYTAFKYKDKNKVTHLFKKPKAPKISKII